jgi:toxin ParE1/3/4
MCWRRRGSGPAAGVAEFRLSAAAERELGAIYAHTAEVFGTYQAEAYLAGLERTFDLLAHFPRIGRPVDEVVPGYRRFQFQSHMVFYSDRDGFVLIHAVLHHSRDIRPGLFD